MANVLIEESTMQAIGNSIRGKNGSTTTYLPSEMPAAIDAIETGGGEGTTLNRSQLGSASGNLIGIFQYGRHFPGVDEIYDDMGGVAPLSNAFYGWGVPNSFSYTKLTNIQNISLLDHTFDAGTGPKITPEQADEFVENAIQLRQGGVIQATNYEYLFYYANITTIPTWLKAPKTATNWTNSQSVRFGDMFYGARYLRKIDFTELQFPTKYYTQQAYVLIRNGFSSNYYLKEVKGLPMYACSSNLTPSNGNHSSYNGSFESAFPRLATFTIANTGPLSIYNFNLPFSYVGYLSSSSDSMLSYYSTWFPTDKRITDATSYAALKNDPAAWTTDRTYSFFNHNSVVELINSAPDMSGATSGTNTFTFYSDQGANTDGGAIGDLTDAEIAVATSKNITITLR